jgi:hypothetical protein
VPIGLAHVVEEPDQVLDDRSHLVGLLAARGRLVAADRGGCVEHLHLECLVAAAPLRDPELDAGSRLERGGSLGKGFGAHVDVRAVLLGEEPEALLGVVPLHLASGHGLEPSAAALGLSERDRKDY